MGSSRRILLFGGHSGNNALGDVWESPDTAEVRCRATDLLLIGRRLETGLLCTPSDKARTAASDDGDCQAGARSAGGIPREAWRDFVMPCLLPVPLRALAGIS